MCAWRRAQETLTPSGTCCLPYEVSCSSARCVIERFALEGSFCQGGPLQAPRESSAFEAVSCTAAACQCAADDHMAELAPSPTRGSDLQLIAEYALQNGGKVFLALGDIVTYEGGAIVNAANRGCQGGGGVDGAITRAGGDELRKLRRRLPKPFPGIEDRCETGDAVRTTAAEGTSLGRLNVKTVIHAVGPVTGRKACPTPSPTTSSERPTAPP